MKGKDIYFLQYDMFGYQSISIGVIDIAAGMYVYFIFSFDDCDDIRLLFSCRRLMSFPYFFSFRPAALAHQANLTALDPGVTS